MMNKILIFAILTVSLSGLFIGNYAYAVNSSDSPDSTKMIPSTVGKAGGVEMKFCKNSPWSMYGWENPTYGGMDQQKLRQDTYANCIEAEPNFMYWPTAKIYILISAPSWNDDRLKVDWIGKTDENNISCVSSDSDGTHRTNSGVGLGMREVGYDTGLFAGALTLSGPGYKRVISESGAYQYGGSDGGDGKVKFGSVNTCKLTAENTGGFSVTWEYSEDQFISQSGSYGYREADVKFGQDVYGINDVIKISVNDRDMLRWSFDSKTTPIRVWSDSDKGGIEVDIKAKRQFWIPVAEDGNHETTITLTTIDESLSGGDFTENRLRVSPGDYIYAEYRDYTLPPPASEDGCKIGFGSGATNKALSACEHKKIRNFAYVSDKTSEFPITLSTTPDDKLPRIGGIIPTDYALSKYSGDGMYKVKLWSNNSNELELNSDNDVKMIFYDGFTEKQLSNVTYDFELVNSGDSNIEKVRSNNGYSISNVSPTVLENSELIISNINGNETSMLKFKIPVVDEINDSTPARFSAEAVETANAETFVDYLQTLDNVPVWIATTTSLWESDSISDAQFISQMKYLLQQNII
jgi:hypothetical protein